MSLTFISAGAGSGKTFTLTQTLGGLLKAGKIRPSGVIATTFTKKAATELRERVRQYLLETGEFAAANAMGQARIGTVNSVCGTLLARFAFEAGLPTQQQVLEEGQANLLIREAIDAALTGDEVAELSSVAYRLGVEDWAKDLQNLVTQCRANDIAETLLPGFAQHNAQDLLQYFPGPTQQALSVALSDEIARVLPKLQQAAQTSTVKKTKEYLTQLENFARRLKGGYFVWTDWISLGKASPEKGLLPLTEPVQLLAQQAVSHPDLHNDIRVYLEKMFLLAGQALAHYQRRKLALGVVDFTDQEHLLLKLLDHPEVTAVLRDELDLLLVDEFQDTSPIQLALFLKLSQLARETYWVGDLKQAIYGFRGSDTALMQAILKALPSLGGQKSVLDRSWRSRPALVNLVNSIFSQAFGNTLPIEEIILKPQRDETPGLPALANWMLEGANVSEISAALAQGVKSLLSRGEQVRDAKSQALRPLRAQDIAILSRTNEGVALTAASLRQLGIPVATSRPGLLATPEATLALACLRRLNDTGDTIATAEIISLADSAQPEVWLAERLAYLAEGGSKTRWREVGETAHPVLLTLAQLRQSLPVMAPREALQRVMVETHLEQIVLSWRQDPAIAQIRLSNLEALLHMADAYEDSCRGARQAATISGLLLWLDEQAEASLDAQAEPSLDAVRVLTHHAAKGLEWPVVILCDLEKTVRNRLWGITTRSVGDVDATAPLKDRQIRYWPWPFGKHSAGIPVLDVINQSEVAAQFQQEAEEEAKRLLYVSMTRPREMLILARKQKAKSAPWLDTLDADWLDEISDGALDLGDGVTKIPAVTEVMATPEEIDTPVVKAQAVHWFENLPARDFEPRDANPSAVEGKAATILARIPVGQRITVQAGADWEVLGSAIHAAIALRFSETRSLTPAEVDGVLGNFGVRTFIEASALASQIDALTQWLEQRWPGYVGLAEVPVKAILNNGQILQGRIDLLLETADGYVLIDHKSSPLGFSQWENLADTYAGQLDAYASAVELASGRKVTERWLFLPVAGGALQVA